MSLYLRHQPKFPISVRIPRALGDNLILPYHLRDNRFQTEMDIVDYLRSKNEQSCRHRTGSRAQVSLLHCIVLCTMLSCFSKIR